MRVAVRVAWLCAMLTACTPLQHPSILTDKDDTGAQLAVPQQIDASPAATANGPESFDGAQVTAADVSVGHVSIKYTRIDGKTGEVNVASLPLGLSWSKHAVTVSVDFFQRPDGARTLATVMDDKSSVLVVGHGFGVNQRILGRFSFTAGKPLGPSAEPRRQSTEVVLHDKDDRALLTTGANKLVTVGASPDAWQLVVTTATTGSGDDEAPALSVDFVLVKQ